jgi:glycosyltransferase involved in cell wall biosynthesis
MSVSPVKRRLAVIDSNFPWIQSGFRYWENLEIHRQLPDTLFFATNPYTDVSGQRQPTNFPAPVYNFFEFIPMAIEHNITDIYCVFLSMAVSLIGREKLPGGGTVLGASRELNMRPFIEDRKIKMHTTIYPGGGLQTDTPLHGIGLNKYYSTIFTNVQEVLSAYPRSIYVPGMINADFYSQEPKPDIYPIKLVFAAHSGIRKNFPDLIEAFNQLDDRFHLHIIGDWLPYLRLLKNQNYTYHGLLNPEQMRRVYQESHVFVSCSRSDWTASDGFPTTAAGDAMATGCLLVTTNSRNDRFVLQTGWDYLEITEHRKLIDVLRWVGDNFQEAMTVSVNGTEKIRTIYNAKTVVNNKLIQMGFQPNPQPVDSVSLQDIEPDDSVPLQDIEPVDQTDAASKWNDWNFPNLKDALKKLVKKNR